MRQCPICRRAYAHTAETCVHDGAGLLPRDDTLGLVLGGKYRIEALIGRGGMGVVYLARQLSLDRRVAVKILRTGGHSSRIAVERFKREALAIARLRHPHIVVVHDFELTSEVGAYIVLEYLEGRSLRTEMSERRRLPLSSVGAILDQVCRGVRAAHERGIIHRDLKPENVFLTRGAGNETAKVLDFGVARLLCDPDNDPPPPASGVFLGTPIYASPELCRGEDPDARSDIYALGCMAYEMLTGQPPFVAQSAMVLLHKQVTEAPIPPSELEPSVSVDVERVVMRALAKVPEFRFASAAEFADALTSALGAGYPFVRGMRSEPEASHENSPRAATVMEAIRARTVTSGNGEEETLVDESLARLDDAERVLLEVLCRFRGACTLEPIESLYERHEIGGGSVLDVLTRLVDKSFVIAEERDDVVHYHILEAVRPHAEGWASDTDQPSTT
jgi:eukaryotic-like serine/threonine-protein kinase